MKVPFSSNRLLSVSIISVILAFFSGSIATGESMRSVKVVPDNEKRSCIQTVDGYAYLSEDKTLSETRSAAFANAKRQAVEMARTFIQSKTHVEDFEIKSDQIAASSEGAVTVLEQKDLGVVDNNRYHVWIKAEVEYALRPKGPESVSTAEMDPGAPLTVKVWTPKKSYRDGESFEIFIQGNRNFYARIVDISTGGDIIQLLPNSYREINFFEGGRVYKIPDTGDRFSLKVTPPYGEDQIIVYASEVPLGSVQMEDIGQGLGRYRGSRESLGYHTRGIMVSGSVAGQKSGGGPGGAEFYESAWTVTTTP
jgi:hypothetical protein